MQLQGFSSIFELFATFTLAYILIDELTQNNFVGLVTERVLRSYQSIDSAFKEVYGKIAVQRESLESILKEDQKLSGEIEILQGKIKTVETETLEANSDISETIRSNYNTKIFAYINCFLFLYCLGVLFMGGIYSSEADPEEIKKLDISLTVIFLISLVYLLLGWFFDKKRVGTPGFMSRIYALCNGYFVSVIWFVVIILFALIVQGFTSSLIEYWPSWSHNLLIVLCICLPLFNFVIYILKAYRRVQITRPNLLVLAQTQKTRSMRDLQDIDDFLGKIRYERQVKPVVK